MPRIFAPPKEEEVKKQIKKKKEGE